MILQGFSGFLFFTGYKMATSAKFFVAIIFCSYLEHENNRLRKRLQTYEDVISRNNLWSYFSKHKVRTTEKDTEK